MRAQDLKSRDNRLTTGTVTGAVELWVQTADINGLFDESLEAAQFDEDNLMLMKNPGADAATLPYLKQDGRNADGSIRYIPTAGKDEAAVDFEPNTLYLVDKNDTDPNHDSKDYRKYNKLLNDVMSPGERIARRLVVRNTHADMTVGFNVDFKKITGSGLNADATVNTAEFGLFEALRLTGYNVTDLGYQKLAGVSGVDGLTLQERALNGQVACASYSAYELWFDYAASASQGYADTNYTVDLELTAYGSFNGTHYIETAQDLLDLLDPNAEPYLKNGDSVLLCDDVTVPNFLADKAFNLDLQGHTLTVNGAFALNDPRDDKDPAQPAFETMDIDMGGQSGNEGKPDDTGNAVAKHGQLIVKGGLDVTRIVGSTEATQKVKFSINAPGVAVRWRDSLQEEGKPNIGTEAAGNTPAVVSTELNVRSFNGSRGTHLQNGGLGVIRENAEAYTVYTDIPAKAMGGGGTFHNPYTISSLEQYRAFEQAVNGTLTGEYAAGKALSAGTAHTFEGEYIELTCDLDFAGISGVLPIGGNGGETYYFSGCFDGNGHSLIRVHILVTAGNNTSDSAIFGYVVGGTIQNLNFDQCKVESSLEYAYGIGGLAGRVVGGSNITNCHGNGTVIANKDSGGDVGGLIGSTYKATISNCSFSGSVIGHDNVGGLMGAINAVKLSSSLNTGDVSGNARVGGIGGINYGKSTVSDCYNYGSIRGTSWGVGGIAGINGDLQGREEYYYGQIENCYNAGTVTGMLDVGAIVGQEKFTKTTNQPLSIITNSYALSGAAVLAIGTDDTSTGAPYFKTDAEMRAPGFAQTLGAAWKLPREGYVYPYPWLGWQMGGGMLRVPVLADSHFEYRGLNWTVADISGDEVTLLLNEKPAIYLEYEQLTPENIGKKITELHGGSLSAAENNALFLPSLTNVAGDPDFEFNGSNADAPIYKETPGETWQLFQDADTVAAARMKYFHNLPCITSTSYHTETLIDWRVGWNGTASGITYTYHNSGRVPVIPALKITLPY